MDVGADAGDGCEEPDRALYGDLDGDEFLVIGGYESGIDAAYHLALQGKRVTVLDSECPWDDESSDPSIALSTYSLERMRDPLFKKHVELFANTPVAAVAAEIIPGRPPAIAVITAIEKDA